MINTPKFYKQNVFIFVLIFILAIIQLIPFLKIHIACMDDFNTFICALEEMNYSTIANAFAKGQGRITSYVNILTINLFLTSFGVIKVIQYLLILLDIFLMGILLKKIFKSQEIAIIFYVFMISFLSISPYLNPFICYPIYFRNVIKINML